MTQRRIVHIVSLLIAMLCSGCATASPTLGATALPTAVLAAQAPSEVAVALPLVVAPTSLPTFEPTFEPTHVAPTSLPVSEPTFDATHVAPTSLPSFEPTLEPTFEPTQPAATPLPASTVIPTATSNGEEAQKTTLLTLVNQLRAQNGCPALQIDTRLAQSAQAHAQDMRDHQHIDHTGSDGTTLKDRLDRAGYPAQLYGENIAASFDSAEQVMAMWTEGDENPSGPHRQNILNCSYSDAGVGFASSDDGMLYWALDLGAKLQP